MSSRKLYIISGTVIALVAVVLFVAMNLGSFAKNTIETIASKALGTAVTIGSLDISLADKTVSVSNIHIRNPNGYKHDYALKLGKIAVTAETLSPEKLVFKTIDVQDSIINFDITEKGTNLGDLKDNITKNRKAPAPDPSASETANAEQIPVIIKTLTISGTELNPSSTAINTDLGRANLPTITMNNIGEKSGGVSPAEVVAAVINRVISVATETAVTSGFFSGISAEALKTLDVSEAAIKGANDTLQQIGDGIGNTIKGLFGN